jgi:YVTN family beta-propeller protein
VTQGGAGRWRGEAILRAIAGRKLWRAIVAAGVLVVSGGPVGGPAATPPPGPPPGVELAGEAPPDGRLLVLNKTDGTLMVFELPSQKLLATVKVGEEPHEVVTTPDGSDAYVSNVKGKSVSVVDLDSYRILRTIRSPVLDYPHGLGVTADGRWVLLTSEGSHRLVLIDARRGVIARAVTTSQSGSHLVALTEQGRRAFIANRGSDTVTLMSLPDLKVRRNIKVGKGPEGIAAAPNGRFVAVALQGSAQVALLDGGSGDLVATLPVGQTPIRVAFAGRSFTAVVSNRDSNDVTVVDLLARRVLATVPVGRRPGGVVVNPSGTRAYVANNNSNSVSVIALPGYQVQAEIKTGTLPDGIAFVPPRAASRKRPGGSPRGRRGSRP